MNSNFVSSGLLAVAVAAACLVVMPLWQKLAEGVLYGQLSRLAALGISRSGWERLVSFVGGMILLSLVIGATTGTIILAIAICFLLLLTIPVLLSGYISRKEARIRQQIVEACGAISNSCRAGLALPDAFRVAARETLEPFATTLSQIDVEYSHGRNLEDVLQDVRKRLDLDEFTLFASAILACWERGGNLPRTLERIAQSLQEHHRLEKKIETDTAEGKKVVTVLAVFPIIFLIGFLFLYPAGTLLFFTTLFGQLTLVFIAVIIFVAIRWSGSIIAIDA